MAPIPRPGCSAPGKHRTPCARKKWRPLVVSGRSGRKLRRSFRPARASNSSRQSGAEADALCGAGYGERSPARVNKRNGYCKRGCRRESESRGPDARRLCSHCPRPRSAQAATPSSFRPSPSSNTSSRTHNTIKARPTPARIHPIARRSTPGTSRLTANTSAAPTAIKNRPSPRIRPPISRRWYPVGRAGVRSLYEPLWLALPLELPAP